MRPRSDISSLRWARWAMELCSPRLPQFFEHCILLDMFHQSSMQVHTCESTPLGRRGKEPRTEKECIGRFAPNPYALGEISRVSSQNIAKYLHNISVRVLLVVVVKRSVPFCSGFSVFTHLFVNMFGRRPENEALWSIVARQTMFA